MPPRARVKHGPMPECPIRGEIEARLDGLAERIENSYQQSAAAQVRMQASLDQLNLAVSGNGAENIGIRGRLLLVQTTVRTWKRAVWLIAAAVVTLFAEQLAAFFKKS